MQEYKEVIAAQLQLFPERSQHQAVFEVMLGMTRSQIDCGKETGRTLLH
jgi:hypothetical protein